MHILKKTYLIIGTFTLYLLTGIIYLLRYRESHTNELYEIVFTITKGMQTRAILGSMALFLIGILFLTIVRKEMNKMWIMLLAYPAGVCMWCLVGSLLLIVGLPFNLLSMLCAIIGILLVFFVVEKPHINMDMIKEIGITLFVFSGIASIASSGIFFTAAPHDYYYHINGLGKALVIAGGLHSEFETYLTAIGIAPTVLGAYAYMIGVDNLYTFHHCLSLSFCGVFSYGIFSNSKNYALVKSLVMTMIMFFLPPIAMLRGWIISNAHSMFLLFIICYILFDNKKHEYIPRDYSYLLIGLVCSYTLLRSDAGIILGCVYVCIACTALKSSEIVYKIILPSFALLLSYYIKIFMLIGKTNGGMFLNWKTISAILLLYICIGVYYLFFRDKKWFVFIQKYYMRAVILGLGIVNLSLAIFLNELYFRNLKTVLYNIFTPEVFWGTTGFLVVVLSIRVLMEKAINIWLFMTLVTAVVSVDLGALRGMLIGVARQGFGDSINRWLSSLLPIFIFGIYMSFQKNIDSQLSEIDKSVNSQPEFRAH